MIKLFAKLLHNLRLHSAYFRDKSSTLCDRFKCYRHTKWHTHAQHNRQHSLLNISRWNFHKSKRFTVKC